jgi:signal transduction histidine kinase
LQTAGVGNRSDVALCDLAQIVKNAILVCHLCPVIIGNVHARRMENFMSASDPGFVTEYASPERSTPVEVTASQKEIAENDALLAALEAVPGFALLLNENRQVVFANQRFQEIFPTGKEAQNEGSRPGEITGCPNAKHLAAGCGTSRACMGCAVLGPILRGLAGEEVSEDQGEIATSAGRLFVEAIASPLVVKGKRYISLSIRDITEKQRLRDMQKKVDSHLDHAARLSALGTLVGGIAHEINNPAAIISANIENLRVAIEGGRMPNLKEVERIEKALSRIQTTITQMKDLHIHQAPLVAHFHVVDCVDAVLALVQTHIRVGNIHVERRFSCLSPTLKGSAQLFQQMFAGIVINSCEAFADTNSSPKIVLHVEETSENFVIRVEDNGCGIPPDVLPQIFDPFFTTKDPGKGLGLGLSFAHRIVTGMGGTIAVTSERGNGTVVSLRFPRQG